MSRSDTPLTGPDESPMTREDVVRPGKPTGAVVLERNRTTGVERAPTSALERLARESEG